MSNYFDSPLTQLDRRSFLLMSAGASLAALAPATGAVAAAASGRSPDWRDESWTRRYPQLSLAERDRRFQLARKLMEQEDLQCLILASPSQSHDFLGAYFAGEYKPAVVLPRKGEPVAFQDGVSGASARRDLELAEERFGGRWIADWRLNEGARGIATLIQEWGLSDARIGCTGLREKMWPTSSYIVGGGAPWNQLPLIHQLTALLPKVEWVDVWSRLLPLIAVKSAEEIEQYKKAAHLADRAARIFFDALRVGGTRADAVAQAAFDVFKHEAYTPTGGNPYADLRLLGRDDIVTGEIIVHVGAIEAQAGWTICMGSTSQTMNRLIDAVHESYQLGLAAAKPGLTMRELQEVMAPPFRRIKAWNTAPLFHGLNPIFVQGETSRYIEPDAPDLRPRFFPDHEGELPFGPIFGPDTRLQPGMTLHLEPNGNKGTEKAFLGANLLITENGAEEYSASSTQVRFRNT